MDWLIFASSKHLISRNLVLSNSISSHSCIGLGLAFFLHYIYQFLILIDFLLRFI